MRRAAILLVSLMLAGPASAQPITLPGAAAPEQPGTIQKPVGPKRAPAPLPKPKYEESVTGRVLKRMGTGGELKIERVGKTGLTVLLTSPGYSDPAHAKTCQRRFAGEPVTLVASGQPQGVPRYKAEIAGCPLNLDLVEGGTLVSLAAETCTPDPEGCMAEPAGLWGPEAAQIPPDQAIERLRAAAERQLQQSWKKAFDKHKGTPEGKQILSDQARFSSVREQTCRDYAGAGGPGWCAAQLTLARAMLMQQLGGK